MQHVTIEIAHQLIAGALPPDEQARWNEHLKSCETCRKLMAEERSWSGVLNLGDDTDADARTVETIHTCVPDVHNPADRTRTWISVIALLLANVLFLVTLCWQLAQRSRADESRGSISVPPELRAKVAAHIGPLETLREDPWIADDYQAVVTLAKLFAEAPQ